MSVTDAIALLYRTGATIRPNDLADLLHMVVKVVQDVAVCAPSVLDEAMPELGRDAADVAELLEERALDQQVAQAER
jgi:hypothetical protein